MSASKNTSSAVAQSKSNVQNTNSKAKTSKDSERPHEVNMSTLNDKLDHNFSQIAHCIEKIKAIDLALQDKNNVLSSVEIEKLEKAKEKKLWARDGFGTQRSKLHREVEGLPNTPGKNNKNRQKQKMRKLAGLKESRKNEDIKDKGPKEDDQHTEGRGKKGGKAEQDEEVDETDGTSSYVGYIVCSPAPFKFAVPAALATESRAYTSAARPEFTAKESETFTYAASPEVATTASKTPADAASPEVADNK